MPVRRIEPGERIGARRGEAVVCIPVYEGHERFAACLTSVVTHTPGNVRVLICDDASPDPRSEAHVARMAEEAEIEHELLYVRQPANLGFPATANRAFAAAAPADVVLLNSDCRVADGWLQDLRAAAYVDDAVATATALTNHGTIVSVPKRGVARSTLPDGWSLDSAAAAVRSGSLRLRPCLLTAVGHCVYVRRSALEQVGDFDLAFSPGYGEEVDFSQRCLHHGLQHVAADDVLVFHHGGASFSVEGVPSPVQAEHEQLLARRYPYYHDAVRAFEQDLSGPLPRALSAARRALMGLNVLIDPGREDGGSELVTALERIDGIRAAVAPAPSGDGGARADVIHRLGPIASLDELATVAARADRLILTHVDLLGYHDPSRFGSFAAWERHRLITRAALSGADHVVFPTASVRAQALAEDLVLPERTSVIELSEGDEPSATAARELSVIYRATCDARPAHPPGMIRPWVPRAEPGPGQPGIRLAGREDVLPVELERPLLALATHPAVGRPVFGALVAGYRISRRLARRGGK